MEIRSLQSELYQLKRRIDRRDGIETVEEKMARKEIQRELEEKS